MSSRHFVFVMAAKNTAPSTFSWTDDEVELLLKVTDDYKVSKTAENIGNRFRRNIETRWIDSRMI